MTEKTKKWVIFDYAGNKIGTLHEDEADDAKDAVLNFADENFEAELMNEEDIP